MYIWIDPPGPATGWLHELTDWDDVPEVVALYPIPDDNSDRQRVWGEQEENGNPPVGERDWWGITAMNVAPNPIPEGIVIVNTETKE